MTKGMTSAKKRAQQLINGETADGTDPHTIAELLKLHGLQYQPVYGDLDQIARKQIAQRQEEGKGRKL